MSSAEKQCEKQPSIKPAGSKRDSRPPEPTGESSDSSRSRSLSAGRTSPRTVEGSKKLTAASSKWNLSHESWKLAQTISSSNDEDKKDFVPAAGSGKRQPRFRRCKELKEVIEEQNSSALAGFKIPKKGGKHSVNDLASQAKSETPKPIRRTTSSSELPIKCDDLVIGSSGKVLGYKCDTATETTPVQSQENADTAASASQALTYAGVYQILSEIQKWQRPLFTGCYCYPRLGCRLPWSRPGGQVWVANP